MRETIGCEQNTFDTFYYFWLKLLEVADNLQWLIFRKFILLLQIDWHSELSAILAFCIWLLDIVQLGLDTVALECLIVIVSMLLKFATY